MSRERRFEIETHTQGLAHTGVSIAILHYLNVPNRTAHTYDRMSYRLMLHLELSTVPAETQESSSINRNFALAAMDALESMIGHDHSKRGHLPGVHR